MKIFNILQANTLISYGCKVVGCGLGNKNKTYIEFEESDHFKIVLNKWLSRQI